MEQPICPKCENDSFRTARKYLGGEDILLVCCRECGTVVGAVKEKK